MKQNRNGDDFYTCLQYPGLNRYLSLFVTDLAFAKGGGGVILHLQSILIRRRKVVLINASSLKIM